MRAASFAAAVAAAALALAGCGGGSSRPHHHIHLMAFERHGKAIFITKCGICHQLADAGTSGSAGPALTTPWNALLVREVIADGPGGMPAGILSGVDAAAVAAYVAAATK